MTPVSSYLGEDHMEKITLFIIHPCSPYPDSCTITQISGHYLLLKTNGDPGVIATSIVPNYSQKKEKI